jgi:tRNA pseudouridine32 synthase/23S rRNA pseudouridine746 synthase
MPIDQTNPDKLIRRFKPAVEIPAIFPSPFAVPPHPLAAEAAALLQQRLTATQEWPRDFTNPAIGKMFGVLVVRDTNGDIGYLSAFSAMMGGEWLLPGFVPPIFDMQQQESFLPSGNAELAALTAEISRLEEDEERCRLLTGITQLEKQRDIALAELKARHKAAKSDRKLQRQALAGLPDNERETQMAALALASQHHKREATDATNAWQQHLQQVQEKLDRLDTDIAALRDRRTTRSRELHRQVFDSYLLENWQGERELLCHFYPGDTPPAGAGDCAAPKLIHYALKHDLTPLALAEFWWGAPPSTGVRHHGRFYPACRGKCHPILPFMLRGLNVEPEPDYVQEISENEPQVVYEDAQLIVVNKPAGLLSMPGKARKDCIFTRLQARYPDSPELTLVHRLDMATSGLLIAARDLRTHKRLQRQFIGRSVEKCYEALLDRRLPDGIEQGEISLPLRTDFDDRPRQMVDFEHGKPAVTRWQVIERRETSTRVRFYPLTGRTHQLRMHAAHPDGLNAPILGDALYGEPDERMMLHARRLAFTHPLSGVRLEFEVPPPF